MLSSIAAYDEAGFHYEETRSTSWMYAMTTNATMNPADQGVHFGGVFTIPVCFNRMVNSGDAPPPVDNRVKQMYPCLCGAGATSNLQGNETQEFRNATGLADLKQYTEWCSKDLNREGVKS